LLGYLPILKPYDNSQKKSNDFKVAVRKTFHKCLKVLLEPIQVLSNGLDLNLNGKTFWFFSQISVVISDWHFCLVKRDNLTNINLSEQQMELRTHNNMIRYLD